VRKRDYRERAIVPNTTRIKEAISAEVTKTIARREHRMDLGDKLIQKLISQEEEAAIYRARIRELVKANELKTQLIDRLTKQIEEFDRPF
jgi:hypothetical protein